MLPLVVMVTVKTMLLRSFPLLLLSTSRSGLSRVTMLPEFSPLTHLSHSSLAVASTLISTSKVRVMLSSPGLRRNPRTLLSMCLLSLLGPTKRLKGLK
nr:hypothetical protein I308_03068 [Cryptococcus tetragattii IND107]